MDYAVERIRRRAEGHLLDLKLAFSIYLGGCFGLSGSVEQLVLSRILGRHAPAHLPETYVVDLSHHDGE